jgi:UDP-2-acetamido-3-amino-2,3-dideoxy-glucuronate N-acetyltransferase
MKFFIHENAICETTNVGDSTRIWAFAHVLPGARIGSDCNICDHVFIENDVILGDRVTVKSGVQLWDGLRVASDVFIGPNVTFANDKFPRSQLYQESIPITVIQQNASIGANATILPGLQIGRYAMVGAGSLVTGNVPPHAKVQGNPARIVGYVGSRSNVETRLIRWPEPDPDLDSASGLIQTGVRGVSLHRLKLVADLRGAVSVAEFEREIPFVPKRIFFVHDVPTKEVRGEHAHRTCHQFLIAVTGSVSVVVDDATEREEIVLDRVFNGLYLPPMIWSVQYRYSADARMLVFASERYDALDYIRDYDEFLILSGVRCG